MIGACIEGLYWAGRTVDSALEALPAHLAFERADAGLLVNLDGHGVLVVAEQAGEYRGKRVVLLICDEASSVVVGDGSSKAVAMSRCETNPLLAHGLARTLLALSHCRGLV